MAEELQQRFRRQSGGWAYAESPLVDGDLVIGTPGGKTRPRRIEKADRRCRLEDPGYRYRPQAAGRSGKGKGRQGGDTGAGYSSAVIAEIGGVKQYVQFLDGGVVGVDAKTASCFGTTRSRPMARPTFRLPSSAGDLVFAASAYGNGGGQAKIVKDGIRLQGRTDSTSSGRCKTITAASSWSRTTCTAPRLSCCASTSRRARSPGMTAAWARAQSPMRTVISTFAARTARSLSSKRTRRNTSRRASSCSRTEASSHAWPHPVVANGKLYIRD